MLALEPELPVYAAPAMAPASVKNGGYTAPSPCSQLCIDGRANVVGVVPCIQ